jgi:hypothetical protein
MLAPISDQEIDDWIKDCGGHGQLPRWAQSREALRKYLQDDRDAHERAEARKAANGGAVSRQQSELAVTRGEIASLKRRVAKLEKQLVDWIGDPQRNKKGVLITALNETLKASYDSINRDLDTIRAEFERTRIKFLGVHEAGQSYAPSSLVTRSGSLWCSTRETRETPGQSSDWVLAVKRGTDSSRPAS